MDIGRHVIHTYIIHGRDLLRIVCLNNPCIIKLLPPEVQQSNDRGHSYELKNFYYIAR